MVSCREAMGFSAATKRLKFVMIKNINQFIRILILINIASYRILRITFKSPRLGVLGKKEI